MIPEEMNLRDWFAGQVLAGMSAHCPIVNLSGHDFKHTADKAYQQADAMMEARNNER